MERVSRRFRRVAYECSWFKITCIEFDRSYHGKVAHRLDLHVFAHFLKRKFQDDDIEEIIKRAKNVKEIYFDFDPSIQIIEVLPESLEHVPFLELKFGETYRGKFRRLKSLKLTDNRFDFFHLKCINNTRRKFFVHKKLKFHEYANF